VKRHGQEKTKTQPASQEKESPTTQSPNCSEPAKATMPEAAAGRGQWWGPMSHSKPEPRRANRSRACRATTGRGQWEGMQTPASQPGQGTNPNQGT